MESEMELHDLIPASEVLLDDILLDESLDRYGRVTSVTRSGAATVLALEGREPVELDDDSYVAVLRNAHQCDDACRSNGCSDRFNDDRRSL